MFIQEVSFDSRGSMMRYRTSRKETFDGRMMSLSLVQAAGEFVLPREGLAALIAV